MAFLAATECTLRTMHSLQMTPAPSGEGRLPPRRRLYTIQERHKEAAWEKTTKCLKIIKIMMRMMQRIKTLET